MPIQLKTVREFNSFVASGYECTDFQSFLRLAILRLHRLVSYESGMFYCAISHDCSYFKPYTEGELSSCLGREPFSARESYRSYADSAQAATEAYVYKSADYSAGIVSVPQEPRSSFLKEQQQYHVACIRIVYQGQFLGEIYLHREKQKPDFNEPEMFLLSLLQPHVSGIFNLIHRYSAAQAAENSAKDIGIGLCALDDDLTILSSNAAALELLRAQSVYGATILHHLKELCFELETGDGKKNSSKTERIKMKTAEAAVTLLRCPVRIGNIRYLAVLQRFMQGQADTDYRFKFTKREADIIDGLVQGKNNAQIAAGLAVSENTVKTHVKNIFTKTGVNSRTELSYILMLNNTDSLIKR
ncbi:helix-turn-helix domain-containing protein [Acetanaerobacterium elongatum]|uniref:Regulatory protein, luxR family n=1 Tax=Acetanaerobacterium elongatum TaxID=258515 RepID=A0A1G9URL1_9FIRM|nr:helix-turn-helix transcriptional regulator [Acetanaerobacterium elongatum]SDM62559.1 regulatory protein, luxR family [Acetanaerobacterium elongatum]